MGNSRGMMIGIMWLLTCGLQGMGASPGITPAEFQNPPAEARPWVYWFWLDGNITREGIVADLEAMRRAGIGGVLIMEVDQGAPAGPVRFGSQTWREMFRFMLGEAGRRGIQVNMNNDAGWTGSGGPWIPPEKAMQRLVWSETVVKGPSAGPLTLPQPPTNENYYRDVAVLAFPRPKEVARLEGVAAKSFAQPMGATPIVPAELPEPPPDQVIRRQSVVDLSGKMDSAGRLTWEIPPGEWTILRFGHTPTGARNHPSPAEGRGLECDKLSPEGADAMFAGLMRKLIGDSPELVGPQGPLVATHIDSWEVGFQNWTARMPEEFARRRGYDLRPYLPVMAGYIVESREISERFLWDFRQTVGELVLDNYAGRFRELARQHGLRLTIEAYTTCPVDELAYAGRADEPMGEFWSWSKYGAAFSCTEMASAAHVYGKKIVGAEAFTATDAERWLGHPGNIKELGDWAFCEGINRFVFHRYALQPWTNPDRPPGMSMGPWGLHYERTQTWWEYARPWHEYLARCQYVLQKGLFVADLCLLTPEAVPQTLAGQSALSRFGLPRERGGFNYDFCPPEVVLSKMEVRDGRLVLPDGMSYSVLVLPRVPRMTLPLVERIAYLIREGATVVGRPPTKTPGLSGYPECDEKLRKLVEEVWGPGTAATEMVERRYGKGRILFGGAVSAVFRRLERPGLDKARWIWTTEGNPTAAVPVGHRYFRFVFQLPEGVQVASAWLVMTVDNEFDCKVNGHQVGHGDDFRHVYRMNVKGFLKSGKNLIAVDAFNAADAPNPAGLIAALHLQFADGRRQVMVSDKTWEWTESPPAGWDADPNASGDWKPAQEVGPVGSGPWGDVSDGESDPNIIPDIDEVAAAFARLGLVPDFRCESVAGDQPLRYIHRQIDGLDVYFVANKTSQPVETVCHFRVTGKLPQIWHPETGQVSPVVTWRTRKETTELPLRLGPFESVFVVFGPESGGDAAPAGLREHVVSLRRDGQELLWPDARRGKIVIRKALYGILNDPQRTRDVTEKIQKWVNEGKLSFRVADLAQDGDPAYLVVKRLVVDFTIDGQPGHLEATDPEPVTFPRAAVPDPVVEATIVDGNRLTLRIMRAGKYTVKTSAGREVTFDVPDLPEVQELGGPWEVEFRPEWGGPGKITLEKLLSWPEHPDSRVKYYSGRAVYRTVFEFTPPGAAHGTDPILDLGTVAVLAEVKVNNELAGIVWKPPYRLNLGKFLKPGKNTLEISVVNLWINRMIGDEWLPEDSDRNPNGTLKSWPRWLLEGKPSPTGRLTFTSWRLWKKDDPLQPSGLLGPVRIRPAVTAEIVLQGEQTRQ